MTKSTPTARPEGLFSWIFGKKKKKHHAKKATPSPKPSIKVKPAVPQKTSVKHTTVPPKVLAKPLSSPSKPSKIKSNDRMPPASQANVDHLVSQITSWRSPHQKRALKFMAEVTPSGLFDLLHSMRRWYTGQTMSENLLRYRNTLGLAMKLDPQDAVGVYRGFKVPEGTPLASLKVGQTLSLPVTRNHGFSSWSTTEEPTNRFSGGGKGMVGLIVKLVDSKGIKPVLAPPTHTSAWFNALYEHTIGKSFRPKEGEYLIAAPSVKVSVVRVKK